MRATNSRKLQTSWGPRLKKKHAETLASELLPAGGPYIVLTGPLHGKVSVLIFRRGLFSCVPIACPVTASPHSSDLETPPPEAPSFLLNYSIAPSPGQVPRRSRPATQEVQTSLLIPL